MSVGPPPPPPRAGPWPRQPAAATPGDSDRDHRNGPSLSLPLSGRPAATEPPNNWNLHDLIKSQPATESASSFWQPDAQFTLMILAVALRVGAARLGAAAAARARARPSRQASAAPKPPLFSAPSRRPSRWLPVMGYAGPDVTRLRRRPAGGGIRVFKSLTRTAIFCSTASDRYVSDTVPN